MAFVVTSDRWNCSAREDRLHPRPLALGQILEHVAPLMHLASLDQGRAAEGLGHRRVERRAPSRMTSRLRSVRSPRLCRLASRS